MMTTEQNPTNEMLRLERQPCSRCGGSGHYSYCQMYGTTCFKCQGKRETLTKRGAAAAEYLKTLRHKRADQLQVGDRIKHRIYGLSTVTEIRPGDAKRDGGRVMPDGSVVASAFIVTTPKCTHHCGAESVFRVFVSEEHERATLLQAIEYQNTLTKAGTPKKRTK